MEENHKQQKVETLFLFNGFDLKEKNTKMKSLDKNLLNFLYCDNQMKTKISLSFKGNNRDFKHKELNYFSTHTIKLLT